MQDLREVLVKYGTYSPPATGGKYSWRQLFDMVCAQKLAQFIPLASLNWINWINKQTSPKKHSSTNTTPNTVNQTNIDANNPSTTTTTTTTESLLCGPSIPISPTSPATTPPTSIPLSFSTEYSHQDQMNYLGNIQADTIIANTVRALNFEKLSDERTKENIREVSATEALEIVKQVTVYLYQYKREYGGDGSEEHGFIAQQLQSLCPQLAKEQVCNCVGGFVQLVKLTSLQDSGLLTVNFTGILALLAGAIRSVAESNDSMITLTVGCFVYFFFFFCSTP
jgi:hypothetical protein